MTIFLKILSFRAIHKHNTVPYKIVINLHLFFGQLPYVDANLMMSRTEWKSISDSPHQWKINRKTSLANEHVTRIWSPVSYAKLQAPQTLDSNETPLVLSELAEGIRFCFALQIKPKTFNGIVLSQEIHRRILGSMPYLFYPGGMPHKIHHPWQMVISSQPLTLLVALPSREEYWFYLIHLCFSQYFSILQSTGSLVGIEHGRHASCVDPWWPMQRRRLKHFTISITIWWGVQGLKIGLIPNLDHPPLLEL